MPNNRTWIAFANGNRYNHRKALKEIGFVNWTLGKNYKFVKDDIVYLFMGDKETRAVQFKLRVDKIGVLREDGKYWFEAVPNDKTYKLVLVDEYKGELLNEANLKIHGFKGGNSIEKPSCNNTELIEYISSVFESLSKLSKAKDEDDDFDFQMKIQDEESDVTVSDTSKQPPSYNNGSSGRIVAKKASISKQALKMANFKCVFDNNHETFMTNKEVSYMEGHHLIPCTASNADYFWEEYKRNIDCVENIVCLCPTCHRRIHFGSNEEKEYIIKVLYKKQITSLQAAGLDVSIEGLLALYNL